MMENKWTLYRTVNLKNNKFYIGVEGPNNRDDDYLGSGLLLKQAIEKHGRENFEREDLGIFSDKDEAYAMEAKVVSKDLINSRNCYNLARGGGGCGMTGKTHTRETKRKISKAHKGSIDNNGKNNPMFGKTHTKKSRKRIGSYHKNKVISEDHKKAISKSSREMWKDLEFRKKMSKIHKKLWRKRKSNKN